MVGPLDVACREELCAEIPLSADLGCRIRDDGFKIFVTIERYLGSICLWGHLKVFSSSGFLSVKGDTYLSSVRERDGKRTSPKGQTQDSRGTGRKSYTEVQVRTDLIDLKPPLDAAYKWSNGVD